jgi:hypothetical protein
MDEKSGEGLEYNHTCDMHRSKYPRDIGVRVELCEEARR